MDGEKDGRASALEDQSDGVYMYDDPEKIARNQWDNTAPENASDDEMRRYITAYAAAYRAANEDQGDDGPHFMRIG